MPFLGIPPPGSAARIPCLSLYANCAGAPKAPAVHHSPPGTQPGTLVYDQGMSWPERIVIEPEILAGKPVVRGTRLAVEFILELLAAGQSEAAILANYPGLTRDDILACLAYASYLAHEYKAYPVPV